MGKLWHKSADDRSGGDELIERFTVGDDYILDRVLVSADCVASMAHAAMLEKIGLLSAAERTGLHAELGRIIEDAETGTFTVERSDEDCHTAIENRLTQVLGEAGKKIHTGRSRNDQVIAALRLYQRDLLLEAQRDTLGLALTLLDLAREHQRTPMPGRTHMQLAMPSSVGLWAASFAEWLVDDALLVETAYTLTNTCPLGSAAGYGVPLDVDRDMVADLLGFREAQNNVLAVSNARGKTEGMILDALSQVCITLSKLAQDLILFSLPEIGYFRLPSAVCTGSSIMPQKRNPDALELVRARAHTVIGQAARVKSIAAGLPSGYNRDHQETKEAFLRGLEPALLSIRVMEVAVRGLVVDAQRLLAGFRPEIFAADEALARVVSGTPFRDAYREVAASLRDPEGGGAALGNTDPHRALARKTHRGGTGNLGLDDARKRLDEHLGRVRAETARVEDRIHKLAGRVVRVFRIL